MFKHIESKIKEQATISDIRKMIRSEEIWEKYKNNIIKLSDRVKDGENIDDIKDSIKEEIANDNLLKVIDDDLSNSLQPFIETEFLRNLTPTDFQKYITTIFEHNILRISSTEQIQSLVDISSDNLKYVIRFLNYLKQYIIIKRYSKDLILEVIYNSFRLEKNCAEYAWTLFDNNRNELITTIMLDNTETIKDIKSDISMLLQIFEEIIEDD